MSLTTITIETVQYTSYATVAEADAYLNIDPTREVAWEALGADDKGKALVAATRRLDLLTWQGEKAGGASQENAWPRSGLTYPNGETVTDTDVPKEVENACILLAGTIVLRPATSNQGTSGKNVRAVGAGSARVEFFKPSDGVPLQDETALKLIRIFLESGRLDVSVGPVVFGTDGTSEFSDPDKYGRSEGFP